MKSHDEAPAVATNTVDTEARTTTTNDEVWDIVVASGRETLIATSTTVEEWTNYLNDGAIPTETHAQVTLEEWVKIIDGRKQYAIFRHHHRTYDSSPDVPGEWEMDTGARAVFPGGPTVFSPTVVHWSDGQIELYENFDDLASEAKYGGEHDPDGVDRVYLIDCDNAQVVPLMLLDIKGTSVLADGFDGDTYFGVDHDDNGVINHIRTEWPSGAILETREINPTEAVKLISNAFYQLEARYRAVAAHTTLRSSGKQWSVAWQCGPVAEAKPKANVQPATSMEAKQHE